MTALVLSVWGADDAPTDGDPIRLTYPDETVVASHGAGFDMQPFVRDGNPVDPASALTANGLLDAGLLTFLGEELWRRVAPGAIAAALEPQVANVLVYLDLRSAKLLELPWELLRCHGAFVFAREQARFCLGRPEPGEGLFNDPPAAEHPVRMMIVIGNKTSDQNIRADDELERIERRAHAKNADFLLKVLVQPAPMDIERTLVTFRPHIMHFVGHGNDDAAGQPVIEVWSHAEGQNELWTAQKIVDEFSKSPPRLVVLNACQTASPTKAASLVDAFSHAGCPAVVGMMGDIRGDASVHFSQVFYEELCSGATVDQACTRARSSLRNLAMGDNVAALRSNWPLPRVLIHGDASTVLQVPQPMPDLRRWADEDFVDRWEHRWDAWRTIMKTSRLTIFCGEKEAGKTALLKEIAETWARSDRRVIHADVSLPPRGGWRELLQRITNAATTAEGVDSAGLVAAIGAGTQLDDVILKYRAALEQCAGGKPLLVAIDGLSEWQQDLIALPELCAPYLKTDSSSPVRMMLALEDPPEISAWGGIPHGWQPIEVGLFSEFEWKRAVRQMAAFWRERIDPGKAQSFEQLATNWEDYPTTSASALSLLRGIALTLRHGA